MIADAAVDAPENATIIITVEGPDADIDALRQIDAAPPDAPPNDSGLAVDAGSDASAPDSWLPGPVLCTLWPQAGCPFGQGCYPAPRAGAQCVAPTSTMATAGEACMFSNDCAPGYFCSALRPGPGPTCETLCNIGGSRCASCEEVLEYSLPAGIGVCR